MFYVKKRFLYINLYDDCRLPDILIKHGLIKFVVVVFQYALCGAINAIYCNMKIVIFHKFPLGA